MQASALGNGTSAALVAGLRGCAGARRGFRAGQSPGEGVGSGAGHMRGVLACVPAFWKGGFAAMVINVGGCPRSSRGCRRLPWSTSRLRWSLFSSARGAAGR